MPNNITFSPACPLFPKTFDVEGRLQLLRGFLDPNCPHYHRRQKQQANRLAAIKAYETGEIDGNTEVWFVNGEITTKDEALKSPGPINCEVRRKSATRDRLSPVTLTECAGRVLVTASSEDVVRSWSFWPSLPPGR